MPLDITFVSPLEDRLHIPDWVVDLTSFGRWMNTDDELEKVDVLYYRGKLLVDMSREQLYSHLDVKMEVTSVLRQLARKRDMGRFFGGGVYLSNTKADLGNKPDGVFVSHNSFRNGYVVDIRDEEGGYAELRGTPDLVIEIVGSFRWQTNISDDEYCDEYCYVNKEDVILRKAYWHAGIPEYWLLDARQRPVSFKILHDGAVGYEEVQNDGGWV